MKLRVHKSITESRVLEAVESEMYGLENPGLCLACGADVDGVEPDARKYECEECGSHTVYGAAEVMIMGVYHKNASKRTK